VGPNQPQAQGGLAETGANLWPAVAGALLLVAGFVVLYRGKRMTR
jgi:LPXTG-motif cell wall-anchored protein